VSAAPRTRRWRRLAAALLGLALVLAACEVVARARALRPWRSASVRVRVEPGGRLFDPHPTLGYAHLPGRYEVTLPTGYAFTVTHGDDTLRVTGPRARGEGGGDDGAAGDEDAAGGEAAPGGRDAPGDGAPGRAIWLFGGSITHGWSLDDEETWPWLLQRAFPGREVVNFGVSGYGTLHGLLQLERALEERAPPAVAVVAYGAFHDERNTFLRKRRKQVTAWSRLGPIVQPHARLDDEGALVVETDPVEYVPWPLQRVSAFVHWLEKLHNRHEDALVGSPRVTAAIVDAFAARAAEHDVALLVAGISADPATRAFLETCRERGLDVLDTGVDLLDPANLNRPHDNHPNARAAGAYASAIEARLRERLGTR